MTPSFSLTGRAVVALTQARKWGERWDGGCGVGWHRKEMRWVHFPNVLGNARKHKHLKAELNVKTLEKIDFS